MPPARPRSPYARETSAIQPCPPPSFQSLSTTAEAGVAANRNRLGRRGTRAAFPLCCSASLLLLLDRHLFVAACDSYNSHPLPRSTPHDDGEQSWQSHHIQARSWRCLITVSGTSMYEVDAPSSHSAVTDKDKMDLFRLAAVELGV